MATKEPRTMSAAAIGRLMARPVVEAAMRRPYTGMGKAGVFIQCRADLIRAQDALERGAPIDDLTEGQRLLIEIWGDAA